MNKIIMINDVAPQDYEIAGQREWCETIQWRKGDILISGFDIPQEWAGWFIGNNDAEPLEESIEKIELSSNVAYFHIMNRIGNIKAAKALGWI